MIQFSYLLPKYKLRKVDKPINKVLVKFTFSNADWCPTLVCGLENPEESFNQ